MGADEEARAALSARLRLAAPGQALPRTARPFPDETARSYLGRLALANHLDAADLRAYLAGDKRGRHAQVDTAALAVLSGLPEQSLLRAVPELCSPAQLAASPWLAGRARPRAAAEAVPCRRCAAARGAAQASRWRTHENVVCLRHRRWTGSAGYGSAAQLDLRSHPEIIAANRRHRRLIRKLGRRAVLSAFYQARLICAGWHDDWGWALPGLGERLDSLGGRYRLASGVPAADAAVYPHAVSLTRLLASPAWTGPVLDEHPGDSIPVKYLALERIDAEIARRRGGDAGYLHQAEQLRLREAAWLAGRPGTRRLADEIRRTILPGFRWLPVPSRNKCEPLAEYLRYLAREREAGAPALPVPVPCEVYTASGLTGGA